MTAWPPRIQRFSSISKEDLQAHDAEVSCTEGIDTYCSSSRWMLPAYRAFGNNETIIQIRLNGGSALFQQRQLSGGHFVLLPLEAVWQLGSPIAATRPMEAMQSLLETIIHPPTSWQMTLLCGIEPGGSLQHAFRHECERKQLRFRKMKDSERDMIRMRDGIDAWMQRRSSSFRAKLRRADRKCHKAGIRYVQLEPRGNEEGNICFERLLAIEQKSWKANKNTGILGEPMRTFTRGVLCDAAQRHELHVVIAVDDGQDVGFVYGSRFGSSYRGLQMTYAMSHRDYSIGNVLQLRMLEWMDTYGCDEFDLGSALPYKARWSDERRHTLAYLLINRPIL